MANVGVVAKKLLHLLFLVLVNKSSLQYGLSVVGDCYSVLNITCFASCSFTSHCWGMKEEDNLYITCFWDALETHHPLQYSATIQDYEGHYCSPTVSCEESSAGGNNLGSCSTVVLANVTECSFIKNGKNTVFSVNVSSVGETFCTSLARFNPCDIVKLDPPDIHLNSSKESLQIVVTPPQCATNSWTDFKYMLRYSTFDGISSAPDKYLHSPPFNLPLLDAQEYRLSSYVAIEQVAEVLRVWSDPREDLYISSPITAADHDFIFYQCLRYGSESSVVATWQKTGIVSGFQCRLTDLVDEETFLEEHVDREAQLQTVFQVQFDNLTETGRFQLSVVAENPNGLSQPTHTTIAQSFCDNSEKNPQHCQRLSNDFDWMAVGWLPPETPSTYDRFRVLAFSSVANLTSNFIPNEATRYNLTNLQTCVLYTVVVESYYSAIKVGHCMFQAFTKEIPPISPPTFDLINTNESSIAILIADMPTSLSCGSLMSYEIQYTLDDVASIASSSTNKAVVSGLQPFSSYIIQVAAINQAGRGPFSSPVPVTTAQAAPSSPPVVLLDYLDDKLCVIAWRQPEHPNGVISHYVMFVVTTDDSELESPADQCSTEAESTECWFQPNQHNVTMKLFARSTVQMQACTDEGMKCSARSPLMEVNPPDPFPILLTVILSSALLLSVLLAICCFHLTRSKGFQTKGPHINSKILREISRTTTNKKDDVISSQLVKEKSLVPRDNEVYDSVQVWRGQSASDCADKEARIPNDIADHLDIPVSDTSDYVTERQSSLSDDEVDATRKDRDKSRSIDEDYVCFSTDRTLPGGPCSNLSPIVFHTPSDNAVFSPTSGNLTPRPLLDGYPRQVYFSEKSADSGVSSLLRQDSDGPTSPTCKHFFPTEIDVAVHADGSPTGQGLLLPGPNSNRFFFSNESVI